MRIMLSKYNTLLSGRTLTQRFSAGGHAQVENTCLASQKLFDWPNISWPAKSGGQVTANRPRRLGCVAVLVGCRLGRWESMRVGGATPHGSVYPPQTGWSHSDPSGGDAVAPRPPLPRASNQQIWLAIGSASVNSRAERTAVPGYWRAGRSPLTTWSSLPSHSVDVSHSRGQAATPYQPWPLMGACVQTSCARALFTSARLSRNSSDLPPAPCVVASSG